MAQQWSDQRIENIVGNLLRAGVLLSAVVVTIGAGIYLAQHWKTPVDYRVFRGGPSNLRSVTGIFREAMALHGRGIIQLGLLLLIATPVARVAFSIWGFHEEHDRMYVGFTIVVLIVLLYSLIGSSAAL